MKRALRSKASVSDVKSVSQEPPSKLASVNSRPLRRRKDPKENKENVTTTTKKTKKNVRKDVAQPLQEKNSAHIDHKKGKPTVSGSSAHTTERDKSSTVADTVSAKTTVRPRNRKQLEDDKDRTEETTTIQPNAKTITDQPSSTSAPEASVKFVTIRKRRPSKAIQQEQSLEKVPKRKDSVEKSSAHEEITATDRPTKKKRQNNCEEEVIEKSTTTKPVVPFSTTTRSAAKRADESNVSSLRSGTRSHRNQPGTQAMKTPTKKPSAMTMSDENKKKTKTPHVSNAKVEQNREKKSTKLGPKPKTNSETKSVALPAASSAEFVTLRKNHRELAKPAVAACDNKSQSKEAIVSNVTKRRQRANSQSFTTDISKGTYIAKRKRTQSVSRIASEIKMDTKSKIDAVVSPMKRRRITKKEDPKIVGTVAKQQQPDLLVNRSTGSDSSVQSNTSTVPIYKRIGNTNNNAEDNTVFDFESNSQENTLNNDEEMQKLLAKMLQEKRASLAKPKRKNRKKGGVTKAKVNVTRPKQIEKLSADLKELRSNLKELKGRKPIATSASAPNVTKTRAISKQQIKPSQTENQAKCSAAEEENVGVINLVDEEDATVEDLSKASKQSENIPPAKQQTIPADDMMDDFTDDIQFDNFDVEDNASTPKPPKNDITKPSLSNLFKLNATSTETPPKQVAATYAGPRKQSTLVHQSTPVQGGNASPWRLIQNFIHPFTRYSDYEKSPIKSGDVTEAAKSPSKKTHPSPAKKTHPSPAKKSSPQSFPEAEKPKTLENDLRTGFGFFDENDEEECYEQIPSLPAPSTVPPHRNVTARKPAPVTMKSTKATKKPATSSSNVFRMPEGIFSRIRETVQSIKNNTQTSESKQTSKSTTQSKITTMFGDVSQPSTSKGTKTTLKKYKYDEPKLKESSNIDATNTYDDKDAFSLFETTSFIDDKPHRSYSRVTKRDTKRQYEYKSFLTDDRSEFGESVVQKRTKRTKPKDNKHEEELRQFQEHMNSAFLDVDNFEMITEKSVSSSNII